MKKVEVYFVINLGAILSLFAIEGELSVYMQRQDDILKNVAQDKLQTLVEISNVESNYEDSDYYRLFFNVEGQYEQGSIKFNPSFTTPIVEVDDEPTFIAAREVVVEVLAIKPLFVIVLRIAAVRILIPSPPPLIRPPDSFVTT